MAYEYYNPNPEKKIVGDCVIRAISKAMGTDWETTYSAITLEGFIHHDMPSSDYIWGQYLKDNSFKKYLLPDTCPACYTMEQFCEERQKGTYIVYTGDHITCVVNGTIYDVWDTSDEVPIFYFKKEENK